jgi:hypothetical protein
MAFLGLVAEDNLADVVSQETAWDNLGNGVTTISGSITIKGKDILALVGVRDASTRDFVFIKNLASPAQPRLTAAANTTISVTTLRDFAMPKTAPETEGNYLFSSSFTLNAQSPQIYGTPALSIATSPFSGSIATTNISIGNYQVQSTFRLNQAMPTGSLSTPEYMIPFESDDFIFYMRAGRN